MLNMESLERNVPLRRRRLARAPERDRPSWDRGDPSSGFGAATSPDEDAKADLAPFPDVAPDPALASGDVRESDPFLRRRTIAERTVSIGS